MPTMMRLQRHGKKRNPFYHIVIADGRAPRDGRFIEKIGTYNPIPNPAEINIKFDKALDWLQKGAQPTDTVKAILSYKGILYKHHLLKGVKKGAMTEAEAEAKLQNWLSEKEAKIDANRQGIEEKKRNTKKELLDAEIKVNETREAEYAKQRKEVEDAKVKAAQDAAAEAAAAIAEKEEAVVESKVAEVTEETKKVEETKAVEETKKVEETKAVEETKVEEKPEKVEETKTTEKVEGVKDTKKVEEAKPATEEKKEEDKETK